MDSDESGEDEVSEVKGFTRKFDSGRQLVSFGPARKTVKRGLDEKRSTIRFVPSLPQSGSRVPLSGVRTVTPLLCRHGLSFLTPSSNLIIAPSV